MLEISGGSELRRAGVRRSLRFGCCRHWTMNVPEAGMFALGSNSRVRAKQARELPRRRSSARCTRTSLPCGVIGRAVAPVRAPVSRWLSNRA
jgi:hypothetical protein